MQPVETYAEQRVAALVKARSEEIWGVTGDQIALRIVPIRALPQHAGL
jgi:hypothetical protein